MLTVSRRARGWSLATMRSRGSVMTIGPTVRSGSRTGSQAVATSTEPFLRGPKGSVKMISWMRRSTSGSPAPEQVKYAYLVVCLRAVQPEGQCAGGAAGGSGGGASAFEYLLVARAEVLPKLCSDGSELDLAAVPGEEARADLPFLFGDRLAHSRL